MLGCVALKGGKWTLPQVPCKDSSTSNVYVVHKVIGFNHKDCHKLNYPIKYSIKIGLQGHLHYIMQHETFYVTVSATWWHVDERSLMMN